MPAQDELMKIVEEMAYLTAAPRSDSIGAVIKEAAAYEGPTGQLPMSFS